MRMPLELIIIAIAAGTFARCTPVGAPPPAAQRYTITELWQADGSYSDAFAINNRGQVVGEAGGHASLWQDGRVTDLGTLSGLAGSRALAINDRGEVVGISYSGRQRQVGWRAHPFVWRNGVMSDLGTLGGEDGVANGINTKGQAVGKSYDLKSGFHAFIWQNGTMKQLSASSDQGRRI